MIDINGVAHIALTVNNFSTAKIFYSKLLPFLGMKKVFDGDEMLYHVGGKTAIGVVPSTPEFKCDVFEQTRVGLHHLCFRARSREDIHKLYDFLIEEEVKIVSSPKEGPWAPGYYYVLFEDPDGIRLEVNHVPGKGVLDKEASFNPDDDYC